MNQVEAETKGKVQSQVQDTRYAAELLSQRAERGKMNTITSYSLRDNKILTLSELKAFTDIRSNVTISLLKAFVSNLYCYPTS